MEEISQGAGAALGERLWGGAAFAVAQALGAAFREDGWEMSAPEPRALDDLPSQTWDDGGEPRLVPATQVALRTPSAEALARRGVIPLMARHDRSTVHIPGIASVADPPAALAGPWDRKGG